MADQETPAASSPASSDVLAGLTTEQYGKYQMTGELPEPEAVEKAAAGESATPDTPKGAVRPAEKAAEQPAEAGKPQETPAEKKGTPGLDARLAELLAKNKILTEQLTRLQRPAEPSKAVAISESTAGKAEHPQGIPKPTLEDMNPDGSTKWSTYEDFADARAIWNAEVRIAADRLRQAKEAAKAEIEKRNKEVAEGWKGRVAEATKRHPDFVEVALDSNLPIPEGSVLDAFFLESEQGPEVLYHLATHREELDRIAKLNPIAQARELVKIEISLTPKGETPPAKKVTSAPPPPTELGSGKTVPEDDATAAVKEGDFATFMAKENARELAASRRG